MSVKCFNTGHIPWNKGRRGLQIAWNKGLTKETDDRVKKYGEKENLLNYFGDIK
jgi:hypothetical protein